MSSFTKFRQYILHTLGLSAYQANGGGAGQFVFQRLQALGAAHTNTTTETALGSGSFTVPAGALKPGMVWGMRWHVYCDVTSSTTTLTLKPYVGATEVSALSLSAVDVDTNHSAMIELDIWALDAPGTVTLYYTGRRKALSAAVGTVQEFSGLLTSVDTTAAITLSIKATWSAADTNSCRLIRADAVGSLREG